VSLDLLVSVKLVKVHLASSDHVARLWEMASGETVRQYNGHHKGKSSPCDNPQYSWHFSQSSSAVVCCALHDGTG